jgi:hypothetical protein
MATYWFKPKRYGYGATPITWQGWVVTGVAVLAIALAALLIPPNAWGWTAFFAVEALVIAVLWVVSRRKTDGAWRWRWGDR